MLLLGHLGITAGMVKVCQVLADARGAPDNVEPGTSCQSGNDSRGLRSSLLGTARRQLSLVDYRMVFLGSLLPDILDKPLWLVAFGDVFSSGRSYAHTFLLNLFLVLCGLTMLRYRKCWLLVISLSSFVHLILDQMWYEPAVLWWPLLGPLPRVETAGWWAGIMQTLASDPGVYIPEIVGLIVILLL